MKGRKRQKTKKIERKKNQQRNNDRKTDKTEQR